MRKSRFRKYGKKSKILRVIVKLVAVWYGCTIIVAYLSSDTRASFNSTQEENIEFKAGSWWDGSILEFINSSGEKGKKDKNKACVPTGISVEVKNTGFTMIGPTTYEVYLAGEVSPLQLGSISPLAAGSSTVLYFNASDEGSYVFKAYQRPMFEGNAEIWSETINLACEKEKDDKDKEKDKDKDKGNDKKENSETTPVEGEKPSEQAPEQDVNEKEAPLEENPIEEIPAEHPQKVDDPTTDSNDMEENNAEVESNESTNSVEGTASSENN